MYQLLRKIFFLMPAEAIHYASMNSLAGIMSSAGIRKRLSKYFTPALGQEVELFNLKFRNPVGLGAGFDKNAKYLRELEALGFGFVEIGTVTPKPQDGNKKPRLFRLPKDKALINRMGFNNDGVDVVAERLKSWRLKVSTPNFIIGGNIGKNKNTPNEEAWKDYELCFKALHPYVDFFVVNVSSPNTPGLRELQEKDSLRKILTHLQSQNSIFKKQKPILLKIAPDLTPEQIDDVIDLAKEINLDGIVASNTTTSREKLQTPDIELQRVGSGGLSGKPLRQKSTEVVNYIHSKTDGQVPIIGSGGIFTAADAKEKMRAGASLVEVWTGFVYEGPSIVKKICKGLSTASK